VTILEIAELFSTHPQTVRNACPGGSFVDQRTESIPGHYSTEDNAVKAAFRKVLGKDPFHD
jgi:hypothetical protein